jgi:hypothetical protein
MTQPNPNDGQGGDQAGGGKPAAKAPAPKLLDVVEFVHRDVITGGDLTGIGVVVRAPEKDDQTVAVRPLAHFHHEVTLANVTALSAADFEG